MPFIDLQQSQTMSVPNTSGLVPGGRIPGVATASAQSSTGGSLATPATVTTQAPVPVVSPAAQATTNSSVQTNQSGVKEVAGPGFGVQGFTSSAPQPTSDFDHKLTDTLQQFAEIDKQVSAPMIPSASNVTTASIPMPMTAIDSESVELSVGTAKPPITSIAPKLDSSDLPINTKPVLHPLNSAAQLSVGSPTSSLLPLVPVTPGEQSAVASRETPLPDASSIATPELSKKQYSLDDILAQAVKMDASDVHLNVGYRAIARKDGELVSMQSPLLDNETIKQMLSTIVMGREDVDINKVRDLDIAYHLKELAVRFRVNIYRERENYAAAFRIVPTKIRTLEELHMPALIRQFTTLEQGLVLVTGATGSGKTTTIAAMLNEINQTQKKHIVTIEDPIEYIYPIGTSIISQRGMREDSDSWADALKSILRQDPDVVLIGEMRDLETISSAMTIAETGHLVFASLHTNDAAQTMDRIIDVFPEHQQNQIRTQLANVLTAVISQKLIPTNAGGGRRVATEILISTSAVQAAIREAKVHQIDNIIQTSAEIGMISMEKSLVNMVRQGLITPEKAQLFANKPNDIISLLK